MTFKRTIVALDATTDLCSVAWTDGARWVERCESAGQRHSALILAMVDSTLREAGCSLRDLSEIAFGAGPGSFTGLRIACGVAQGVALGAQVPVRAVSSLLALAQASGESAVVAALDARMNEVYWAAYRRLVDGSTWHTLSEPAVSPPAAVLAPDGDCWVGVGNGFAAYPVLGAAMPALVGIDASVRVTARAVAELALANQGTLGAADAAFPHYVRDKVALTTAERAGSTVMLADVLAMRPMAEPDLPAVIALDRRSHLTPWTEGNFRDALAAGNLCLVGEQSGKLAAYAVLQMVAGEAELLTMAVLPAARRKGLGRQLLSELIARASVYRAAAIWLEVRVSNTAAIALYHEAGFAEIGWRKGYYQTAQGREDAIMMRLALALLRREH